MKRILFAAFVTALLSCVLCAGASAKYEPIAEELATVGMFRGTANGYELDRVPTRAEAAIMLTRLYGAENEANAEYAAGKIAHPFTDVSAYASPYVAWLYTNGVVKGVTETAFDSQRACGLANYTAFLLRALGYQDGADFRYSDALSFVEAHGLKTSDIAGDPFTRDNLVLMTCRGLGAKLKGEEGPHGKTLSMKLLDTGRLDGRKADALQRYVDASRNGKDEIPSYALPREQSAMTRWKAVVSGSSISYVCREPDAEETYAALPDYRVTSLPDGFTLSELRVNGLFTPINDKSRVQWEYRKGGACLTFQCLHPVKNSPSYSYPIQSGRFVEIQGCQAELYTGELIVPSEGNPYYNPNANNRNTYALLFWENEEGKLFILYGNNVGEEALLETARSVRRYDGEPLNLKTNWIPKGYIEQTRISAAGSFQKDWLYQNDRLILLASPDPLRTPDADAEIIAGDNSPEYKFRTPMYQREKTETPSTVMVNGEEIDASDPVDIGGVTVTSGIIKGGDWMNTLTWKQDGINYQLCGSPERDELLRIARNIR